MEITQHAKYNCTFCGKVTVKRTNVGIWNCRACGKTVAGGGSCHPSPPSRATRGKPSTPRANGRLSSRVPLLVGDAVLTPLASLHRRHPRRCRHALNTPSSP